MKFLEIMKSRYDKKYIITEKSPQSIRGNIELIKRTISKNENYIFDVDLTIIEQELDKYNRGEENLIDFLVKRFNGDYYYTDLAPFYSDKSKTFWINNYAKLNASSANKFIQNFIQNDYFLNDEDLKQVALDIIKDKKIDPNGTYGPKLATIFKDNELYSEYVCKYFTENSVQLNNVNADVLRNVSILNLYTEMINKYGFEKCIEFGLINRNNISDILGKIIESTPEFSVDEFVDKVKTYFGEEEIEHCFEKYKSNNLLSLYLKYRGETLQGATFNDLPTLFNQIPKEHLEIILRSRYPLPVDSRASFIDIIKGMDLTKANLLVSMIQVTTKNTDNWFNYVNNIIYNLYGNSFDALIKDTVNRKDELTKDDLEKMSFLFSKPSQELFSNQCNIESLDELRNYEQIRNNCSDYIISSKGQVSDEKIFDTYRNMDQLARLKDAYLNKYFYITYFEATIILNSFSNIVNQKSDLFNEELIQAFKDIKSIYEAPSVDRIDALASNITMYDNQFIFEDLLNYYNELYSEKEKVPLESDIPKNAMSSTEKAVKIFESTGEYNGLIKIVTNDAKDAKKKWHSSTRQEGGYRYGTCVSYADQAKFEFENDLLVGFKLNNKASIRLTSSIDAHTPDLWDTLGYEYGESSQFLSPDEIRGSYDNSGHNELVLNTMYGGEKLEPSYVISLHDEITQTEIDFASEFDIPVIHMPKMRIKNFEKARLANLNEKYKDKNLTSLEEKLEYNQFVLDCRRFKNNYGENELASIINIDGMQVINVPEVIQSKIASKDMSRIVNKEEVLTSTTMHM